MPEDTEAKCRPDSYPLVPASLIFKSKDQHRGKAGQFHNTIFTDL